MTPTSKPVLPYINLYRALAIVLVVATHGFVFGAPDSWLLRLNMLLFASSTFAFVFISSFLFQYLSYKFEYKNYLKKKLKNVISPYLVIIFPLACIFAFTAPVQVNPFYYQPKILQVLFICLVGQVINPPMWYMVLISIYFVFAKMFYFLTKYPKAWLVITICLVVSTFSIDRFQWGARLVWHPAVPGGTAWPMIREYLKLDVIWALYFLSSYFAGMWACLIMEKKPVFFSKHRAILRKLMWCCVLVTGCIYMWNNSYIAYNIFKFVGNFALLDLCVMMGGKVQGPVVDLLANYSFGIFFLHFLFLNIINYNVFYIFPPGKFNFSQNTIQAFIFREGSFVAALVGSILFIYAVKKVLKFLKVKNTRMFIGA